MSSFPDHEKNIKDLDAMGFDVSEAIEDGGVTMESWGYDYLVYQMRDIIDELKRQNFKNGAVSKDRGGE